jgi:hypothetical protein
MPNADAELGSTPSDLELGDHTLLIRRQHHPTDATGASGWAVS